MLRCLLASVVSLAIVIPSAGWSGGMTLGHPYPNGSSYDIWARDFANCVEQEIGLYVEVIGEGRLGRSRELAQSVTVGAIDAAILPVAAFSEIWPELTQLDTPGIIMSADEAVALSGRPGLAFRLEDIGGWKRNIGILGIGWRYSVMVGPDLDVRDLDGVKFRTSNAIQSDLLHEMGAVPVRVPSAETFAALEFGAIDGAIVDAETAITMAEKSGFSPVGWSEDFAPFASAHVAVISLASTELFGFKNSRQLTELCSWTTLEFTNRSIELARSAARLGQNSARFPEPEWQEKLTRFLSIQSLDPEIQSAMERSLSEF